MACARLRSLGAVWHSRREDLELEAMTAHVPTWSGYPRPSRAEGLKGSIQREHPAGTAYEGVLSEFAGPEGETTTRRHA